MSNLLSSNKDERKQRPIARGVFDYFPQAIAEVANVSFVGNQQHNPGETMHWSREKSTDHADCIARHLIERDTLDSDGLRHSAKVAWRALAMLQLEIEADEKKWGNDDRRDGQSIYDQKHNRQDAVAGFVAGIAEHMGMPGFRVTDLLDVNAYADARIKADPYEPTAFCMYGDPVQAVKVSGFEETEAYSVKAVLTQKAQDEVKLVSLGCSPKVAQHVVGGITYCGVQNAPYVYIFGPMRGYPKFNFPAFDAARDKFVQAGFNVISPADIDRAAGDENSDDQTTFVYRDFYSIFFLKVGTQNNGMLAALPRFERSVGATSEMYLARWLKLPVLSAATGEKLNMLEVCEADVLQSFEDFIKGQ